MKLVPTLVSLLTTVLILPFALSTPLSPNVGASRLVRKSPLNYAHRALAADRVPITNAERFARGLPPLSPSKSRNLGSPTRRDTASPVPLTTIRGYVEVYKADGSLLGHIAAKGGYDTVYDWTSDPDDTLIVSFSLPVGQSTGSGLNLLTENSQKPSAGLDPYFGFSTRDYANISPTYDYDTAWLNPTSETQGTAGVGTSGTALTYVQSNVWSININTGEMTAKWTNSDGTVPDVSFRDYTGSPILGGPGWGWIYAYPSISLKFIQI